MRRVMICLRMLRSEAFSQGVELFCTARGFRCFADYHIARMPIWGLKVQQHTQMGV
jgi:hypothetical protein